MKAKENISKTIPKIFQDAIIDNDLKKYRNHPVARKKVEMAIETLKKVKNSHTV